MAYYIEILDITRFSPSMANVAFQLHQTDGQGGDAVVDTSDYNLPFETAGLPAVRRLAFRKRVTDLFDDIIARAEKADADFDTLKTNLVGVKYPAGA